MSEDSTAHLEDIVLHSFEWLALRRWEKGKETYKDIAFERGNPLGRNSLIEAYEELLDAYNYLRYAADSEATSESTRLLALELSQRILHLGQVLQAHLRSYGTDLQYS